MTAASRMETPRDAERRAVEKNNPDPLASTNSQNDEGKAFIHKGKASVLEGKASFSRHCFRAKILIACRFPPHSSKLLHDSNAMTAREAYSRLGGPDSIKNPRFYKAQPAGFEPATDGLEIRCSIQLSYGCARGAFYAGAGENACDTRALGQPNLIDTFPLCLLGRGDKSEAFP
jgi:hypothetical protein